MAEAALEPPPPRGGTAIRWRRRLTESGGTLATPDARRPDGPTRPWLVVGACAASLFLPGALIFGFPGVMAAHWQAQFGVGKGAIGNVLFFSLAGLGVLNVVSARLPERLTPRARIGAGTVIFALSLVIVGWATQLWQLYLWAFVSGFASVLLYVPAVMIPQLWVPKRRGLASGVVSMTFGLAAAPLAPLFGWMLTAWGYRPMLLLLLALILVVGLPATWLVRMPPVDSEAAPDRVVARATTATGTSEASAAPERTFAGGGPLPVRAIVRTRSFWALWFTWALQGGAGIAMVTLSVGIGVAKGYSTQSALVILAAFNLTNGASRLLAGTLSDYAGRNLIMTLTFVPAGLAYFALPHVGSLGLTAVLAAVVGFGFGSMFAVSAPLAGECFGLASFATVFSLAMTAYGFVAGLLGPALAGHLLDVTGGNYTLVLGYLGTFSLVSAVLVLFVRPVAGPRADARVADRR
jgi:OFA family oxalate/formate antiporter-like MFS transporter